MSTARGATVSARSRRTPANAASAIGHTLLAAHTYGSLTKPPSIGAATTPPSTGQIWPRGKK